MALKEIVSIQGGLVVASEGWIRAKMSLPFGGLMTDVPLENVISSLKSLQREVRVLGCHLSDPFMALSFIARPVIPHLKLTDKGLVDVDQFKIVSLFGE